MTNLNIAIAGLGTVGAGVVKILTKQAEIISARCGKTIKIVAVSARNKHKDRGIDTSNIAWYENAVDIADDANVDLVVELIGGDSGAAYDLCEKALANGKHFVTANKALIARHGAKLTKIAEENNVSIAYEAAVAGGIPIIKSLKEGLAGNNIKRVSGILNGTCNYMLTAMKETERDFDVILKEAQDLGYAEADPAFDIEGTDAAHKLVILASIAFGAPVNFNAASVEGITAVSLSDIKYADELGYKIKLLGLCSLEGGSVNQTVQPCLIANDYPLAKVDGVNNAVFVEGDAVGNVVLEGPGAGEGPTASAVVADIIDIASERFSYAFGVPASKLQDKTFTNNENECGEYYIRINVADEAGVLANITDIFKRENISMESLLQKPVKKGENVDIVCVTHNVARTLILKAAAEISQLDIVLNKPSVIKIEK